ncbi:MAG: hypothetical protein V8S24_11650 [Gordonibacter pamelaeae]
MLVFTADSHSLLARRFLNIRKAMISKSFVAGDVEIACIPDCRRG